ncbi:pilus assembly protein [Tabrizicola sp. J26]|uniref:TadE/TadG family type IV pilus assembly protein n=1 Tax=Alitabrizicola rongguiensis TaxID=2909234 RepID=UPI001F1C568E|nr:TadE/TadG family type IV pilus assembly protein [Tabrizicola rongguiensis]MCF1710968.1 pilus assembly protein [Tabrizicola rongguiensis]
MTSSNCSAENCRPGAGRGFARAEDGAILVEFALVLPMLLLVFAVIVEGSRMMWSYQAAISGVRDATRYLARILPADICAKGGTVTAYETKVTQIVDSSLSGLPVLVGGVTVDSVTPALQCHPGSYRGGNVAVAQVTATVTMTFPMGSILTLFGGSEAPLTTSVTDQSRVFGA